MSDMKINKRITDLADNPLEILERIIAFDSRDWFKDKRDRLIYAIVLGWGEDCEDELIEVGFTKDDIKRYEDLHQRYVELKELPKEPQECEWEHNIVTSQYETSCDETVTDTNCFVYCPYCGRKIRVVK